MKPGNPRPLNAIACAVGSFALPALLAGAPHARACGYHDPSGISRGGLNLSFPDALHVHTAVWQAQVAGVIPRTELPAASDGQPEVLRALVAYRDTVGVLGVLGDRLQAARAGRDVPAFSVVLVGPVLWARFAQAAGKLEMAPHVAGPSSGDVVVVTDAPVLAALAAESITPQQAREQGLVRFYGTQDKVREISSLFDGMSQSKFSMR